MRLVHALVMVAALLACAAGARAAGTIITTGATITVGAGTPQGTVTIEPALPAGAAPSIPAVGALTGSLGTFTSPLPAFPGGGTGADGAFVASGAVAPVGTTFNFTSYTVNAGAIVTYSGPVTILVTGDVVINGTVTTNAAGASITIRSGGSLTMGTAGKVQTLTATSAILLDANGAVATSTGAQIVAAGDCEVRAHGGSLAFTGTALSADPGDLTLRASAGVALVWLAAQTIGVAAASGNVLAQAFSGSVVITNPNNGKDLSVTGGSVAIEASAAVDIQVYVTVASNSGPVRISAFGGDLRTRAAFGSGADMTWRAAQNVIVPSARGVGAAGALTITAFGGDVNLSLANGPGGFSGDSVTVEASGSILTSGASFIGGSGDVLFRAVGDKVSLQDGTSVGSVTTGSAWNVRAANRIEIESGLSYGSSVSLTCGAGGVDTGLASLGTTVGPLDVTTLGQVTIAGAISAHGPVTLTSCDAGVAAVGASIQTDNGAAPTSPSITIQSFADTAGTLDLTNATIATSDADAKSGDIRLRVFQGKTTGGGAIVDSFLLPSKWTTKINAIAAKSKLTVSGTIDLGSSSQNLNAVATLHVGTLQLDFPAPVAKGKKLIYSLPGSTLTLTPATGFSRVPFSLTWTGDLTGAFSADGTVETSFQAGSLEAKGSVVLVGGRFALSKAAGKLNAPGVFPRKASAALKGNGQDSLALTLGFATGGTAPATNDPFSLSFGGTFTADVSAGSFIKKGEKLTFKGSSGGVTNVTIDYAKGVATMKGKGLDLGPFADGANIVTIKAVFGGATRTVVVGMAKAGTKLAY